MLAKSSKRMPRTSVQARARTRTVARHLNMSSVAATATPDKALVLFESDWSLQRYILNRPKKQNALDSAMISALRPKIQEWDKSDTCDIVVGTGNGASFCCGGDVINVVRNGEREETRPKAIQYFKDQFELDYGLARMKKPYICVLNGFTVGGGIGLSVHAPFRIATESTKFAMWETRLGYVPDAGASHFLPQLDGEIGTYLGLAGHTISGHAVFELGLATHYVPSRRIPDLFSMLALVDRPSKALINAAIEEHCTEPQYDEPRNPLVGDVRVALDAAFGHDNVEEIFAALEKLETSKSAAVGEWAKYTRESLQLRSPTSLKVSLQALRRGKYLSLANALRMEMGIATAFLAGASPDFFTGVNTILVDKVRDERPPWNPGNLSEVTEDIVKRFFDDSPYVAAAPTLDINEDAKDKNPMEFALPTEDDIKNIVSLEVFGSSGYALTSDDVLSVFRRSTHNKRGVEEKVREVVARKCEVIKDRKHRHYQRLRWK